MQIIVYKPLHWQNVIKCAFIFNIYARIWMPRLVIFVILWIWKQKCRKYVNIFSKKAFVIPAGGVRLPVHAEPWGHVQGHGLQRHSDGGLQKCHRLQAGIHKSNQAACQASRLAFCLAHNSLDLWCVSQSQNKGDMDVDVKVLSPNNWPVNFPPPACTLPPFAADAFAAYEE